MQANEYANLMQDVPFFNGRKIQIDLKTRNPKLYCLEFIKYQTPILNSNMNSSNVTKSLL